MKSTMIVAVINMARALNPAVHCTPKYGGTVFMTDAATPSSLVGGVFGYTDYVSVEFSNGALFNDPNAHLIGKGKARRHVKLHSPADIEGKTVEDFLKQAFAATK